MKWKERVWDVSILLTKILFKKGSSDMIGAKMQSDASISENELFKQFR